jgi:hypothetical protein
MLPARATCSSHDTASFSGTGARSIKRIGKWGRVLFLERDPPRVWWLKCKVSWIATDSDFRTQSLNETWGRRLVVAYQGIPTTEQDSSSPLHGEGETKMVEPGSPRAVGAQQRDTSRAARSPRASFPITKTPSVRTTNFTSTGGSATITTPRSSPHQ